MFSFSRNRFMVNRRTRPVGRQAVFETLEQRRLLAGDITLIQYFSTWDSNFADGGLIGSADPGGMAYHAPSGHLILADPNVNETPGITYNGENIFEISLAGDQVFRKIVSNNSEPTGITYNAFDGFFYVTNDRSPAHLARYDDTLNTPLAMVRTRDAVADAADPEDVTSDPVTGFLYVADGASAQVLVYDSDLAFQYSFSVSAIVTDPEGIAFHPTLRHLFISSRGHKIYEYALNGTYVEEYDMSGFSPRPTHEYGLEFAPTSNPDDDPAALSLYVSDRGSNNYPDGRIFETSISGGESGVNTAPLVMAGPDQTIETPDFSVPVVALLDATVVDDGQPDPPGAVVTQWSLVSGPPGVSVTFGDAGAVDTTVSFPAEGDYVLRLTADDGALTASDEVTITVYEAAIGDITMVRYFDVWGGNVIRSTDPAGVAYQDGHLYLVDSELDELSGEFAGIFNGNNIFEVSLRGDQVFREITSNNLEPAGITYSPFDGYFYIVNDDDMQLTRYDSRLDTPLAVVDTRDAVANANDPEGITADPVTGYLFVADGEVGGRQVLVYDSDLVFRYSFSVAAQMADPEGIAFHPTLRHLFLVSKPDHKIFEYMLDGTFVREYDISGFSPPPNTEQGLTFGPSSDDPGVLALYIADGGIDNYPDGRVYETLINPSQQIDNMTPLVIAGDDQTIGVPDLSTPAVVQLDATVLDDALPNPPGTVTLQWEMISGPGQATFDDEHAAKTAVNLPAAGTYLLRLTANDGELSASDELTVTVDTGVPLSLDVRVAASSDDAEERLSNGKMYLTSSDLELISDKDHPQLVGMRFTGLDIPAGAMIQSAYLQFYVDETNTEATSLTIQGEATANAATFTATSGDISSRPRTITEVPWSPPEWPTIGVAGPAQRTPDISAVIQEIINEPGWTSGNALAIIISGSGHRTAKAYDGIQAAAPLLHVEFFNPHPGQNVTPLVTAGDDQTIGVQDLSTPAVALLDGTVLDDGQPDPPGAVTTEWSMVSGPAAVTFADANAVDTTVSLPAAGTYVLRLTADDGESIASDELTIVVNDGIPLSLDVRVSASSDDAEERLSSSRMYLTSSDLDMIADRDRDQLVGIRFNGLEIPPGATIASAFIQFQADEVNTESTVLNIQGEVTDNATTFTTNNGNLTSRPRTTASVSWSPPAWNTRGEAGDAQRTSDIAAVIQEIVNRPGWTSGNSLVIIISGSGVRTAESYDGKAEAAPLLHVEFSIAGTAPAPLMMASIEGLSATEDEGASETLDPVAVDAIWAFLGQ